MRSMIQWLISLYPAEFRRRFEMDMLETTFDSLEDPGGDNLKLLFDVAWGAARENFASANWLPICLGVLSVFALVYLDGIASEVQTSVFVLMSLCFLFSSRFPRKTLFWALLFGLSIPFANSLGHLLGHLPLRPGSMVALVPAFIGAYAGLAVRTIAENVSDRSKIVLCLLGGTIIGILDFTLITPAPALIGVGLCGWVLGRYGDRAWKAAFATGFGVPLGIVLLMAAGGKPVRGHFVLVDARAALVCVVAESAGSLYRKRFGKSPDPLQRTPSVGT